jgi:hypothetical protein
LPVNEIEILLTLSHTKNMNLAISDQCHTLVRLADEASNGHVIKNAARAGANAA